MPTLPVIRDAVPADAAALAAIYAPQVLTGTASYEDVAPDAAEMARRLADVQGRGLPWLVAAESGGGVVGYAYASPYRSRAAYRFTLENSIYVAAGQEGRGIGRALLRTLLHRCAVLGYRRMLAIVGDSRNSASLALHRAAGFVEVGRLPGVGVKFGEALDQILLIRDLQRDR
ncbi:GNAT family N-acetyltransferase [Oleisolibacter albus]|uniref:GNAT family N-acetyltransferase n=1 Tax=Oleisolibacter albus TaxID=2171757 RepID=UPI000DF3238E|nr:GNAT family N-acetyltransferase [Oleisolibacter albus]